MFHPKCTLKLNNLLTDKRVFSTKSNPSKINLYPVMPFEKEQNPKN